MKGVLSSYRWRRRLARLAATVLVVVGVLTVALKWPNTAPKEKKGPSNIPARIEKEPEPVQLKGHDRASALKVVSRFIYTAVARKNIDRSWNLVAPEFRGGLTRKQWDTGNMPVVPYPTQSARWKLQYSDVDGVGFSVALFPTEASHQPAQVFLVGLHTLGSGPRRHWVIDNWQSAPTRGPQTLSAEAGGTVLEQVNPKLNPLGKSSESAAWLLLPVGLLSLIILLPLGIASLNWYRGHRAERALLRS